jgi:flagellar biosynthesis protein FliR
MELFQLPFQELNTFFLVLARVSILMFLFPFFGAQVIPTLAKIGLSLLVALALCPVLDLRGSELPTSAVGLVRLTLGEFVVGLVLGVLLQVFFEGVKMMGEVVGFQTGFSITNILDPQSGMQVSVLSNMAYSMGIVLFLILNGHHILLSSIRESFEFVPVGSVGLSGKGFEVILGRLGEMFIIAVKLGAPAIACLLLVNVALGVVTKMMPQMNVMIVAFPVQIIAGLFFFGVSLAILGAVLEKYVSTLNSWLPRAMALMKG